MDNAYSGREQTLAKHFILRRYLQALTFKLLEGGYQQLTYVDGFSGPWKSKTADYSDTSFMIAINVLRDAHQKFRDENRPRVIKCFFVEESLASYRQLEAAVTPYHMPANGFHVATRHARFEDAIPEIKAFVGNSFALTFIDPTGWTGFPFEKVGPIFRHEPGEVLVNFMFDHVNRFAGWDDPKNIATFDSILGGPNWKDRLDPTIPIGRAVEKLFCGQMKAVGAFKHVLSTHIEKATSERIHFSIAYGTRSSKGLTTFRDVEYSALRDHKKRLAEVKQERDEMRTGQPGLFAAGELPDANSFDAIVEDNIERARNWIVGYLRERESPIEFGKLWEMVIENFMLRETNVKDICVDLAKQGVIGAPWKSERKKKPHDHHSIGLAAKK